jgi:hypothetical protein
VSSVLVFVLALVGLTAGRTVYNDILGPEARLKRSLLRRPRVAIRDASGPGLRIDGQVHQREEPLLAPVSRRACVAFHLVVEEWLGRGWTTLLELRGARSFELSDETGTAVVDTDGPFSLGLRVDETGKTGWPTRMDPSREEALKRLLETAYNPNEEWPDKAWTVRYSEAILRDGEWASVGGNGVRDLDPAGSGHGRTPPERLVLRGTEKEPVLIADGAPPELARQK